MKIPQLFRHKKLLATAARRASAASAGMDFGDIPEPNMKLSRALLIVLLLHVVAVSGIIAFNAIKTRESSFVPTVPAYTENKLRNTPAVPSHQMRWHGRKARHATMRSCHIRFRMTNTRRLPPSPRLRRESLRLREKLTL
jgi:hypothetical protein